MAVKTELSYKLKAMQFFGRFVAACIVESMYINLHLSKPFIKQVQAFKLLHSVLVIMLRDFISDVP